MIYICKRLFWLLHKEWIRMGRRQGISMENIIRVLKAFQQEMVARGLPGLEEQQWKEMNWGYIMEVKSTRHGHA